MTDLFAFLVGYAFGSVPFGLILTRLTNAGDLRSIGSGNIGATNVLRTGRKGLAAATLALDMLKGTAAVLLVRHLFGDEASLLAGLGAFIGHLYPVWIGFKGGKGVATFLGIALGTAWPSALAFALVWLTVAFASRYSSLSALVATVASVVAAYWFGNGKVAVLLGVMTLAIYWSHRANIRRLVAGTESKIGQKG